MFECPSVDAIVGSVELAFKEPCDVALSKGARANGLERAIPGEGLVGLL